MDDIQNDITINKTGALVWKRRDFNIYSVGRSFWDIEPLDNKRKK